MIELTLVINAIAIITCGIAAGMNFSNDNTVVGISMVTLSIANLICFMSNLGRI